MAQKHDAVHYRLNERDEIVFVNDAWDAFAARNSGGHLSSARVLGRPLWMPWPETRPFAPQHGR